MKYLKYFEEVEWKDLNIGDYITFDYDLYREGNTIIVRKNYPYEILNMNVDNLFREFYIRRDDKIPMKIISTLHIKKISKEEAECIIDSEKYNL